MRPQEHEHAYVEDSCCWACFYAHDPDRLRSIFIVCTTCGNKRCPKGTDHDWDCTGSNASGQEGSMYASVRRGILTQEERDELIKTFWDDTPPTVEP